MGRLPATILGCLLAVGCAGASPPSPSLSGPTPPAIGVSPSVSGPTHPAIAAIPGAEVLDRGPQVIADVSAEDVRAVAAARNQFALDVFRILAADGGNVVLGPDSISNALTMAYAGAAGATAEQMRTSMHLPLPDDALHKAAGALDASIRATDAADGIEMLRGTRLFGQNGYEFGEPFLETLSRDYGAPLAAVEFQTDPEAARAAINAWVADLTRALIEDLMPKGTVDTLTRLVIVDAQYMKAAWDEPFDPDLTRQMPFELPDGQETQVEMMSNELTIAFGHGAGWVAGELPYVGDRLAMLVVVPDEMSAFASLEAERLDEIVAGLESRPGVPVYLPRFEVRQHSDLLPIVGELGMTDLSNFAAIAPGLFVSAIEHEAVVKVNEEGTEAAAATGVGFDESAPAFELRADRPFLFFIRDRETGAILFMGRVADPR
jgi:serine protease inhibitor